MVDGGAYNGGAVSVIVGAAMLNGTTGGPTVGTVIVACGGPDILSGAGTDVLGWICTVAFTDVAVIGGSVRVGDAFMFIVDRSSSCCNAVNASAAFSLAI